MNTVRAGRSKALLSGSLAAVVAMMAGMAGADEARAAEIKKANITAVYNINFNGMSIGEFSVRANVAEQRYTLNADAKISVLAGLLFEWHGKTSTSGRVINRGPLPAAYSFGYTTSDKGEQINVKFSDNIVREVAVNPPQRLHGGRIPVTRAHLQNVIDPMTAVLVLSNTSGEKSGTEVCNRNLPIFDGKARYDLQLSYKRTKQVKSGEGYKGAAYVCKVKYIPIAGHRPGEDDSGYAARNEAIEVWMIPISQSGLFVPYYIYMPTPVGTVTLTSARFDANVPGTGRRARVEAEVE